MCITNTCVPVKKVVESRRFRLPTPASLVNAFIFHVCALIVSVLGMHGCLVSVVDALQILLQYEELCIQLADSLQMDPSESCDYEKILNKVSS